ncbi:MAG: hypothetical protein NC122_06120 [Faecalibacterium sp.]|nr:hypothetical protein [Ruminococcus sp.]MCM1393230.1 hypothetical protein [Ruminococcus sp.]MCM1485766.1 hypothetical protein [Faecalibacterium sp.]
MEKHVSGYCPVNDEIRKITVTYTKIKGNFDKPYKKMGFHCEIGSVNPENICKQCPIFMDSESSC